MSTERDDSGATILDVLAWITPFERHQIERQYGLRLSRQLGTLQPGEKDQAPTELEHRAARWGILSAIFYAASILTLVLGLLGGVLNVPFRWFFLVSLLVVWLLAVLAYLARWWQLERAFRAARLRLPNSSPASTMIAPHDLSESGDKGQGGPVASSGDPSEVAPDLVQRLTRLERWSARRWYRYQAARALRTSGSARDARDEPSDIAHRSLVNGVYYSGLLVILPFLLVLPYGMSGLSAGDAGSLAWTASILTITGAVAVLCVLRHLQINRFFRLVEGSSVLD